MSSHALIDATARFFGGELSNIFDGITFASVLPVIGIVLATVVIVSILGALLSDSPGAYSPFGRSLAVAASDFWTNRNHYGLSGRTFEGLGPLEQVLDALSESVKKWESDGTQSPNSIKRSPQFLSSGNQPSTSEVRFE